METVCLAYGKRTYARMDPEALTVQRESGLAGVPPTPAPPHGGGGEALGASGELRWLGERQGWAADASGGDIWGHEMVKGFGGGRWALVW